MKIAFVIFFLLSASTSTIAQSTVTETTTLAIKQLLGLATYHREQLFVSGIIREDDNETTYGIKPSALCEGYLGNVTVSRKDGAQNVALLKEFSTLADAEKDMNEMIAATQKYCPALHIVEIPGAQDPNVVELKCYGYEAPVHNFISLWSITKQPNAEAGKRFSLLAQLEK